MDKQPAMTAEQATQFSGFSMTNATLLGMAAQGRGCKCNAYEDWFTYRRWIAQGFQVRKGEKASKITVYTEREYEDKETGDIKSSRRPFTACVFCRCQVGSK